MAQVKRLRLSVAMQLAAIKSAFLVMSGLDVGVLDGGKTLVLTNHFGAFALVLTHGKNRHCVACSSQTCTHVVLAELFQSRLRELGGA